MRIRTRRCRKLHLVRRWKKNHTNVEELVGFVQNEMAALDRCNDTDAYSLEHV